MKKINQRQRQDRSFLGISIDISVTKFVQGSIIVENIFCTLTLLIFDYYNRSRK